MIYAALSFYSTIWSICTIVEFCSTCDPFKSKVQMRILFYLLRAIIHTHTDTQLDFDRIVCHSSSKFVIEMACALADRRIARLHTFYVFGPNSFQIDCLFLCVCKNQLVQPPFDSDDLTECSLFRVYSFSLYLSFWYPSPTELHWHMQIQEHKQHYRSRRYLYSYILKRQHYFFYPLTKYWTYLNSLSSVFVSYSRWLRRFIFFSISVSLNWYNVLGSFGIISTHAQTWSLSLAVRPLSTFQQIKIDWRKFSSVLFVVSSVQHLKNRSSE